MWGERSKLLDFDKVWAEEGGEHLSRKYLKSYHKEKMVDEGEEMTCFSLALPLLQNDSIKSALY